MTKRRERVLFYRIMFHTNILILPNRWDQYFISRICELLAALSPLTQRSKQVNNHLRFA